MSVSLINNVLYSLLLLCPLVVIFCSAVIGRDTPKTGRSGLIGPRRYQTGWWRGWIGWTTYEGRNVERTKVTRSQRNQSCHEHQEYINNNRVVGPRVIALTMLGNTVYGSL